MDKPPVSAKHSEYWKKNLQILGVLLVFWFVVSFGCGVLWVDWLDQFQIGGFKLGFWFAQQGSIFAFIIIIAVYIWWMNRLDKRYEVDEEEEEA
jgi:putative solute:sodium symporter small subunit